MFVRLCLALSLATLPLTALADELFRAPAPPWVDRLAIPEASPALTDGSSGGVVYLLSDRQFAWQGEELFTYARTATQVTDRAGLEVAAAITVDYDPAYETLTLTHLHVIRGGQVIDVTDTPSATFRREQGLEDGIIDGDLTVSLQVPDLRVGDTVDYGTLRRTLPMVAGDNRGGMVPFEYSVPVGVSRVMLNWPADWPTYFAGWPAQVDYKAVPQTDGTVRHSWTAVDGIEPLFPEAAPPDWDPALWIEWSADADWSGVAAALTDHYLQPYPLGAWEDRVEAIRRDYATDGERAMAALRMVQDELRYVSLAIGEGGIFARRPADVVASGFGDCKDKALLLRTMLDRLGIPARVALTDLDHGHQLDSRKPSLNAFDHAIVTFDADGASYWVDPTMSHQGGDLWSFVPPDYGFALPLDGPNRQALEAIPFVYTMGENRTVNEDYAFGWAGVHLTVTTTLSGRSADDYRQTLAVTPRRDMEADFLDFYQGLYPGLRQIAPMEVSDDRNFNSITLTERYFLPSPDLYAPDLITDFGFGAPDFAEGLPRQIEAGRRAPVWLGPVANYYHTVTITNAPISFEAPAAVNLMNKGYSYGFEGWEGEAGTLTMNWTFTRTRSQIDPRDAGQALEDASAVTDSTWFTWNLLVDE